jgi:excisionase family DNA binding protein
MTENQGSMKLLLSAREAAKAMSISERTLWTLTKEGKIPCVRIKKRVLYNLRELERWIENQ